MIEELTPQDCTTADLLAKINEIIAAVNGLLNP